MYEISRKQERERRKIIFPARLHVRDITENVVGLDLAEWDVGSNQNTDLTSSRK